MASVPPDSDEVKTHLEDLEELLSLTAANERKINNLRFKQLANLNSHMAIMVRGRLPHNFPIRDTGGPRLTHDGERDVAKEQLKDLQEESGDTSRQLKALVTESEDLQSRIEEAKDWFTARGRDWKTGEVLKGRKKVGGMN